MESSRRGVVGDLDLRPEPYQLVERALFGAVRVRRRQDAQRLAGLAMSPEGVDERSNAAPANERHHDVDRICGGNLGTELVADGRLAGRVGEDGRIEQRSEWALDRLRPPIREALQQRDQHTPRVERRIAIEVVHAIREKLELANQRGCDSYRLLASLSLRRAVDRPRDDAGDMP